MQTVIILGGDQRSRFLDTYFRENGFFTYCFGLEQDFSAASLKKTLRSNMAALILPLPASRDGKTVRMPLCADELTFGELAAMLMTGQTVFGGMLSENLKAQLTARGARVTDYYDDEVIVKNAVLTARGAIRVLASMTSVPPARLRIAVTGFGRVGTAVAAQLQENGCTATVAARRAEVRAHARQLGYRTCTIAELQRQLSAFDVVINTVPVRIFPTEVWADAPHIQYMELASAPCGTDLAAAEAFGLAAINAQSLPGKYFPREAAQIVGEKIKSFL